MWSEKKRDHFSSFTQIQVVSILIFLTQIWFGGSNKWLLKVKISCYVFMEFLTFNAYELNMSYQIWVGFIFVYQKSLKGRLKLFFEYKITFWICVLVLWIHNGYCVVKLLVWNIRIKAFTRYSVKIKFMIGTLSINYNEHFLLDS